MKYVARFFPILGLIVLTGCASQEKPLSQQEAKEKIFAPTDVNGMSPEMRARIPQNGLGPAGTPGQKPEGAPGAPAQRP